MILDSFGFILDFPSTCGLHRTFFHLDYTVFKAIQIIRDTQEGGGSQKCDRTFYNSSDLGNDLKMKLYFKRHNL